MFPFAPPARPSSRPIGSSVPALPAAGPVIPPPESTSILRAIRSVGAGLTTRSSEQRLAVGFFLVFHVLRRQPLSLSLEALGTYPLSVYIAGELQVWPTREQMAALLRESGLRVTVDRYSVRVDDCSHFVFQHYGGDLGQPTIDADAESSADLRREAGLVSAALARADLVHRFELYSEPGVMVGYLHYRWPLAGA